MANQDEDDNDDNDDINGNRLPTQSPGLFRQNAVDITPCTYGEGSEQKWYYKNRQPVYRSDPLCNTIIENKSNGNFLENILILDGDIISEHNAPSYAFKKRSKKSRGTKKSRNN